MKILLTDVLSKLSFYFKEISIYKVSDVSDEYCLTTLEGDSIYVHTIESGRISEIYKKYCPTDPATPNATVFSEPEGLFIFIDEFGDKFISQEINCKYSMRFLVFHEFAHLLHKDLACYLITDAQGFVDFSSLDPHINDHYANGYAAERLIHELEVKNMFKFAQKVSEVMDYYKWKGPGSIEYKLNYPNLKNEPSSW